MSRDFIHLHVASAFSAHYGTAQPEELVAAVVADGVRAAALTERDGVYGAVRHIRACLAAGVAPIVGADLQIAYDTSPASDTSGADPSDSTAPSAPMGTTLGEITVLAHGGDGGLGWASLARIISAAHAPKRGAARRRVPHGSAHRGAFLSLNQIPTLLLGPDGPTATVLLGPHSDVGQALLDGQRTHAYNLLQAWQRRLPGGVAVELVCHLTRPGTMYSLDQAALMWRLARRLNVPAVLTNQVRYLNPDEAITGDVLDSVGQLLPLGAFEPQPNGQAWLKPTLVMESLAQSLAEHAGFDNNAVADLLNTTQIVADRCQLDPVVDVQWRRPKVPELEVLGITGQPDMVLRQYCDAGLSQRYPRAEGNQLRRLQQRLEDELATINGFGFASYFLTVADVSHLIRDLGSRVQARGSGAGSLVNYLLRISNVDPLEHDLLFERFLGKARSTLPDIDLDVESARRHEIYRAIFERYGEHRVTLLSMQNTYRARGATRDAGLALGMEDTQIDQVASSLWRFQARDFRQALGVKPELRDIAAQVRTDPRMDLLVDLAERLDRLPRHISMHPCGVILGTADLLSLTPVQPSGMGLPMSQFDKNDIDDMGLLKLDVLGVRMQSTMAYAVREIIRVNETRASIAGGLPVDAPYVSSAGLIDLDAIPHDDEPTFDLIRSTYTLGIFQIESPGQRELVGKMQPDHFEDLIADISLFRPGPMKADMVNPFVQAKQGFEAPHYPHPRFKPFLSDSYGVVIYHEHVLRIFHDCMGVDLAEADELRRAMGHDMDLVEAEFRRRSAQRLDDKGQRLFTPAEIDRIWAVLYSFGSFGFCKAHAAAFALATYQSAWLKTHYPVEFLAGIFEHDPGMYPRRLLMAEARRLGVPILPLDVNASDDHYKVEMIPSSDFPNCESDEGGDQEGGDFAGGGQEGGGFAGGGFVSQPPGLPSDKHIDLVWPVRKGVRLSLRDVHAITGAELGRILAGQPYESIVDFQLRAAPSRSLLTRLAAVGALDSLNVANGRSTSRGEAIAYVRQLTARTRASQRPSENQPRLFSGDVGLTDPDAIQPTPLERVSAELDVLGYETSQHLIDFYRPLLDELDVTPASELLKLRNHSEVIVAGVRVATQTPPMKSGKRVVFISVDDGTGCADCTFFDDAQQRVGSLLFGTRLLVIHGTTRRTGQRG
ncbi:MAG: DNA polymerase III subunit alpha, partial [Propionibacteriaceae bacterium]|nr:DNA polymerase III subunit alpha [Propionibacteriaceae bacterium]